MADNNIYAGLPEELAKALKRSDILAGPEQLEYFYQLYDPTTGGFYYSISSRDAEDMTPFAEGTSFSLEALKAGGMTLPEWYKEKVSEWILGHQDESDGFFYEELWGKITSVIPGPRLYRDLSYSTGILNWCDKKPLYTLPADRIKQGVENSTLPEYLESREKLLAYLDSLDWSTKAIWGTGQRLTTASTLFRAAGYFDLVRDYIISKQNPETGLWGESLEWMNTNGAMKLSFCFDNEHPVPNPEKAIESVLKIYSGDTPPSSATWVWNPFVFLHRLLGCAGERKEELRALLIEKGADIVNRAIDCAMKMHREDGGFASSFTHATPAQQGYIFGYGTTTESDLDGTLIAGQRLRAYMHSVFGVPASHDYYVQYNDEFWERIKNKPAVVKTLPRPKENLAPKAVVELMEAQKAAEAK